MSPSRVVKDSASDISRRYGLEDLSRARGFARRFYINSLASKAFSLVNDYVPVDDELDCFLPRSLRQGFYRRGYHHLRDLPVLPRRSLPSVPTRMLYDQQLVESAAARRDAVKRAEQLLSRYYLDDPLAILDEELDAEIDDENVNEGDKNSTADKEQTNAASSSSNERQTDQVPALPDGRQAGSRRLRHHPPRVTAEAIYRILDSVI